MGKPSYFLKLTLTEIALRRMAVILWNGSDILALIAKTRINTITLPQLEKAQKIVESKVLKLELPEALKKQIMLIVKPIGLEIKGWKNYHENYTSYSVKELDFSHNLSFSVKEFDVPIFEKLCWTAMGTVDYRKTAEQLICCKMLNIVELYKLACLYCLEDYIADLWKELPEHDKYYFYNEEDTWSFREPLLMFCWPYILKGEEYKLDRKSRTIRGVPISFNEFAFENSSFRGNKAAIKYFFPKLTPEEANLIETAHWVVKMRGSSERGISIDYIPSEKYSEVLCYLLSLMTPEQQMEVFKKQPCTVLKCFLDWPLQDLFLEVSDFMWAFLSASDYDELVSTMWDGFFDSNYCFPKLFHEFFIRCPMDFRKYFVDCVCQDLSFLNVFAMAEDSETIKVIFRNVDAEDRVRLVSSRNFYYLFNSLLTDRKWHMVEVCLREARLTKEDRVRFKGETFAKFLSKRQMKQQKWRRFFQLLDQIYARAPDKRSLENKTLTKAKRKK